MHDTTNTSQKQAHTSRTSQARTPAQLPWDKDPAHCEQFGHLVPPEALVFGGRRCTRCGKPVLCPDCTTERPYGVVFAPCARHQGGLRPSQARVFSPIAEKGGSSHGQV